MRVECAPGIRPIDGSGDRPGDAGARELGAVGVEVVLTGPCRRVERVADDDFERDSTEQRDLRSLGRWPPQPGGRVPVLKRTQRAKVELLIAPEGAVEGLKTGVVCEVRATFGVAEKAAEDLPASGCVERQITDRQVAKVARQQATACDWAAVGVDLDVRVLSPGHRGPGRQDDSDEH